jgi:hypothetical protein
MSYFQYSVAPIMTGALDKTFWTRHVPQVAESDPAARHAVIAISSLYEDFSTSSTDVPPSDTPGWHGNAFALRQYNLAIRRVLAPGHKFPDLDTLLTVSLLFTCIELLQGNSDAAIKHCQHGINVYNSPSSSRLSPELSGVFSHLSIFPPFFGRGVSDVPLPRSPALDDDQPGGACLDSVARARETLHSIMARAVRLVRLTGRYRTGAGEGGPVGTGVLPAWEETMQRENCRDLDTWADGFAVLRGQSMAGNAEYDAAAFRILEMRWLVSKIWTDACLHNNETIYDQYMDRFQRIVDIAEEEQRARAASTTQAAKFTFEMGLLPLLYVVVIKCRNLSLRARALMLMRNLSCSRETLWDADIMYAAGIRVIEVEHHIWIEEEHISELAATDFLLRDIPLDEDRIRDLSVSED